ncbi:MAG: hypothetical protein HYR84_03245 [Planctomycetes bacterium]|nr:hypothetical protein [Planctomycetota bacterium]
MRYRSLSPLGILLIAAVFAQAQGPNSASPVGFLAEAASPEAVAPPPSIPFSPRPGDIVLYDEFNRFFQVVYKLANTSGPTHTAIVIARPDGTPALLELTGPRVITAKVVVMDVDTRFKKYPGVVMVRRIRKPLTAEQSRALTDFAQAEVGKSFAIGRVILQGTPFCPRTGLRHELFAKTHLTRNRWFCSELVVAAGTKAGLFNSKVCCSNATYPRDLAFDERIDISALYHPPLYWVPETPR